MTFDMNKYHYFDMHCDTLQRGFLEKNTDTIYDGEGMQSIKLMEEAEQLCQFYAVFFPPRKEVTLLDNHGRELPPDDEYFTMCRNSLIEQTNKHLDVIAMANSYNDIITNKKAGKCSAVLTIEDGRMVDYKMEKLSWLYEMNVRAIALTWNFANCFGSPNSREASIMNTGLTDFGKEAVKEMNRLGILIDVSHLSDGGFRDVYELSEKPFIASHSDCRALTDHPRNLTDEMIRMIANKGGVIGINLEESFCTPNDCEMGCKLEYLAAHVLHMLDIGGEDVLGLGSDYDGIETAGELPNPTFMYKLFDLLKEKGMTGTQLEKMVSGNSLRVFASL